jgi:Zn-dependent peptidase ImmA (M78 family)
LRTVSERFNPDRLLLARKRRAMTKVSLAAAAGLTLPPKPTVERLAEALQFPVAFFYRPSFQAPTPEIVSFRSFSKLSAGQRDAALAAAGLAIELTDWFADRYSQPEPALPDLRGLDATGAALALRSQWGLGDEPAPNVIHLLEASGVRVFSLTSDCAQLDAFSFWHDRIPFVFLTRQKSAERTRWDATHELAHLVLHLDGPPQGRDQEAEADRFAAEFLLPEQGFRASAPRLPSLEDVLREKLPWQVSAIAYIRRLHQLGIVTDWQYRTLIVEASSAGYRRTEGDIQAESSQVWAKVKSLMKEDGITLTDVGNQLAIPSAELRALVFSPLTLLDGEGLSTSKSRQQLRALT